MRVNTLESQYAHWFYEDTQINSTAHITNVNFHADTPHPTPTARPTGVPGKEKTELKQRRMKRKPRTKWITKRSHSCESFKMSQMLICFLKRSLGLCHVRWSGKLTRGNTLFQRRGKTLPGMVELYTDIWPHIQRSVSNGDIIKQKKESWIAAVNHLDDLSLTFNKVQQTFFRYFGPHTASLSCTSVRLISDPNVFFLAG